MALQVEGIADLLTTTLKQLGRFKFTDAAASLQKYTAFTSLMREGKAMKYNDGTAIQWNVMVAAGNAARMTGLYAVDQVNQGDYMKVASVPWRHITHNFAYDRRELAINAGASRILDIVKTRRYACYLQLAEKLETQLWSIPTSSTSDDIYGIPYHIVKNATEGFNGGHASGFSDWAGLSRTTYTNLKNYTAPYTTISRDDFLTKLSDACDKTFFQPPVEQASYGGARDYGFYTTLTTRRKLKNLLEQQNDNLGMDLDPFTGRVTFRRTPVEWVPKLDSDTDAPFYGINWTSLHPAILTSEYFREQGPSIVGGQHTVFAFFVDSTMNLECWNPREQFVLSNGTSGSVS